MSKDWAAKSHDYGLLKHEFSSDHPLLNQLVVSRNFDKNFDCQAVSHPNKKPKQANLSLEAKAENQRINSRKIWVKHAIVSLKWYRYLSDRL